MTVRVDEALSLAQADVSAIGERLRRYVDQIPGGVIAERLLMLAGRLERTGADLGAAAREASEWPDGIEVKP